MRLLFTFTATIAAATAAYTRVGEERVRIHDPLVIDPMLACYDGTKHECIKGLAHQNSTLGQIGCTIIAETDCKSQPHLPEFCPDSELVRKALTWTPPTGCQDTWDRCLTEINIPFFNLPICGQYLPILCKNKLDPNSTDELEINRALDVLYTDFIGTLNYFSDHIPADKAEWFEDCLLRNQTASQQDQSQSQGTRARTNADTDADADTFFSCLEQVKNQTSTAIHVASY